MRNKSHLSLTLRNVSCICSCCRVLKKKKGDSRSGPNIGDTGDFNDGAEDGEVTDSESDIGDFDDGLDDELMGDEEDR